MGCCCCDALEEKLGLRTLKVLGRGGQGVVLLCEERGTGRRFACKVISSHYGNNHSASHMSKKRKLQQVNGYTQQADAHLRWEAQILYLLRDVPGILPLAATLKGDDGCIHVLTPFCNAGDVLDKMVSSFDSVSERESAHIINSVGTALSACHARGIVHRDIKPGKLTTIGISLSELLDHGNPRNWFLEGPEEGDGGKKLIICSPERFLSCCIPVQVGRLQVLMPFAMVQLYQRDLKHKLRIFKRTG